MAPVKEGEPCAACGLTSGTYSPSPHHLPPGTILVDRYLVGRVLGEGGFGITYIGCDLRLELKVAIKEYFPSDKVTRHAQASLEVSNYTGVLAGNYEQGKEKYLQEARTMARMNKQAEIVSVRDFFEANNTAYIVMEYVEGTTFKELVAQKGGRIPAGEFFHMIEPLFSALSVMHETGLIHRDISPDNLMLENGCVRLLDFGCARESTHGTETMTIALKHGYAPIEQYQHKGQGPWTDVYGLCATMYYCLTGKVPQQSLDRLCEDELILPRKLGVDLTENQERALLFGMGIRPRRRYQSMEELYAALYTGVPAPKIEIGQSLMFMPEIGQQETAAGVQSNAAVSGNQAGMADMPKAGADIGPGDGAAAVSERQSGAESVSKTEAVSGSSGQGTQFAALGGDSAAAAPGSGKEAADSAGKETHRENGELSEGGLQAGEGVKNEVTADLTDDAVKEKRRKTVHRIKIGVAGAAIVLLVASPFLLQKKLSPAFSDTVVAPAQPVEETPEKDPFAEAIPVTTANETALRAALNGDAEAVIWEGNGESIQLTGEPLNLTKPLYIGKNSHIEIATELTVEEGGLIRIAGEMENRGFLYAEEGGLIEVQSGGRLCGAGSLFVEQKENFTVENDGMADICGVDFAEAGFDRLHYVPFSEEEIFRNAAHVRTGRQLMDALDDGNVSSVVIDGDITLADSFRYMDKSVMVSEGVTLTAPWSADASVCFDGWYFVNYGTVSGCFQVGDWKEDGRASNVINYGQITNELFVESDCNLVNRGQMAFGSGWMKSGRVYNLGELVHDSSRAEEPYLEFLGVQFTNLGTIRMEGEEAQGRPVEMRFGGGTEIRNHGVIEIGENSRLENEGTITGYGQILATDTVSDYGTEMWNHGVIRMEYAPSTGKAAMLQMPAGVRFDNEGLIAYPSLENISIPREFEKCNGAFIPFAWGSGGAGYRDVSTAEELKEALADDACRTVIVTGENEITLTEELVVTKGLAVAWPATIQFTAGGLTLTGEDAYLYDGKLTMNGNPVRVSEKAVLDIETISGGGPLYAENGGQIILRGYEEDAFLAGQSVVLENGGRLLSMGYSKLENRTVSIEGGSIYRILCDYDMTGSNIEIKENGELLINTPRGLIDETSTITNHGKLVIGAWDECMLNGEIVNNNSMECYVCLNLDGGRLINNGTLRVDLGDRSFTGDGTIENNGTIRTPGGGLLNEFRGNYSGYEINYGN